MNGPQKSQHFTFIGCRGLLSWNRVRLLVFIYSPNSLITSIECLKSIPSSSNLIIFISGDNSLFRNTKFYPFSDIPSGFP